MDFVGKRKIFFSISIIIILIGIVFMIFGGLNEDIDFAGGTAIYINIGKTLDTNDLNNIRDIVTDTIGFSPSSIQKTGDQGQQVVIKTKEIDTNKRQAVFEAISKKYNLDKEKDLLLADNVSPTIGDELKSKALWSSIIAALLMLVYIWFRFELLSGVAAVLALVHDIFIMLAVYAIFKIPVNSTFIAAMLTILGYSINDTIVLFDRIRENKKHSRKEMFSSLVNKSISQTLVRSINTSVTTLLTITFLYALGVPSIKEFALPLMIGIISGTYSSIFIASPLWAAWKEMTDKRKSKMKTA